MSAVEGSLGFLPRRILVDSDEERSGAPAAARGRPRRANCAMVRRRRDATSLDAILGGRLRLRQTLARPSRRRRRRPARGGGRAAGARGSSMSARASARSAWRCCSVGREARADLVEIDPEPRGAGARERRAQRPRGSRPRRRARRARRAAPPRRRARRRRGRPRRHQSAVLRRRDGARFARRAAARARTCSRRAGDGARSQAWIVASSGAARAGRPLRHDPPADALPAILAAFGQPARRRRDSAGPSARRRARDRLLISGVKGSKAPLRLAPAWRCTRRPAPSRRCAEAIHRGEATIDWRRRATSPIPR